MAFSKKYNTDVGINRFLTSTPLRRVRHIEWQHPHDLSYREEEHYDDVIRGFTLTIDRTRRKYVNIYGDERTDDINSDLDEMKVLAQCSGIERGLAPTLATMRLLEELPLYPMQVLWANHIEALGKETYLNRDAIRIHGHPVCPAFMRGGFTYDIVQVGDYQSMLVDMETGILLERQIIIDGLVAESEYISSISVDKQS